MTRTCCVCGATVTRDRFRSPPERTTCNLPAPCRNRLVAKLAAPKTAARMRTGRGVMHSQGYVYLYLPGHHRAMKNGYVKRADVLLEAKLGRPLRPREIAHHKNNNRLDDDLDNLEPIERGPHQRHHTADRKARGRYIGAHQHQPRNRFGKFTKS